jgi:hypothetical protein
MNGRNPRGNTAVILLTVSQEFHITDTHTHTQKTIIQG